MINTMGSFDIIEKKILIRLHDRICETTEEILNSDLFKEVVRRAVDQLSRRRSTLLAVFGKSKVTSADIYILIQTIEYLTKMPVKLVPNVVSGADQLLKDPQLFNDFIEYLYNYWRSFDRFILSDSTGRDLDKRPYRTFNSTIGQLTSIIRGMYRDIQENVVGKHPRIYRQVSAGAEVSTIAVKRHLALPGEGYEKLAAIPLIRQILLYPPLILNPPMNKRTGRFERVHQNPLDLVEINERDWLCYPAKVGSLLFFLYFNNKFAELGHSLANLFELADDDDLSRRPDGIIIYGAPGDALDNFGVFPTVFFDDTERDLLVGAIPDRPEFGYFGYLKKMSLTLHNIIMMKKGKFPFHGALVRVILKGDLDRTILFVGDTGAGKSETLEALRELGDEYIQDLFIIADDMGSLDLTLDGKVCGYGTEIGAFLRLDDLQPGYALGQIDRAIIMSPNQVNARIILPVTSFDNVIKGHNVDFVLYANNYEDIDADHPILEQFRSAEQALNVFREGTVMSKGTTTSTGIVHSYFANVFGPPQYKDLHEPLAKKYFQAFFDRKLFVGQFRTRLGLTGWERNGPQQAAEELLKQLMKGND